jgi:Arc/MetJ-type ribon-helix-helix transcriptional regulator
MQAVFNRLAAYRPILDLTLRASGITVCRRGYTSLRPMKTLSLKLPDSLDGQLEALASRQRTSKSAVVREAISGYLEKSSAPTRASSTALAGDLAGSIEGPDDLSLNLDYLADYGT